MKPQYLWIPNWFCKCDGFWIEFTRCGAICGWWITKKRMDIGLKMAFNWLPEKPKSLHLRMWMNVRQNQYTIYAVCLSCISELLKINYLELLQILQNLFEVWKYSRVQWNVGLACVCSFAHMKYENILTLSLKAITVTDWMLESVCAIPVGEVQSHWI